MVEQYGQDEANKFYRAFLTEALEDFQRRNPQLVVFDASVHFDEVVEGSPHIHIDTLPIAEYSKGMTKKVSLEGALKMQGYDRKKSHSYDDTPYKNFLRTYRAELEGLAGSYANIIPSEHKGKKHTPTHVHRNRELIAQNKKLEVERDQKVLELLNIEPEPQLPPPLPEDKPRPIREHRGYTREEEKELEREQKEWDKRHAKPNAFNRKGGERYQAEQEHAAFMEQKKKDRKEWELKNRLTESAKRERERNKQTAAQLKRELTEVEQERAELLRQMKAAKDAQFAAIAQKASYDLEHVLLPTTAELFVRRNYPLEQANERQL